MKHARHLRTLIAVALVQWLISGAASASVKPTVEHRSSFVPIPSTSLLLSASVDQLRGDIATLRQTLNTYETNGKALDNDLQLVLKALDLLDKMARSLKTLDQAMTSVEKLLEIAKGIPQTHDQATTLSDRIKSVHPSVTDASTKVNNLNDKLTPTRQKLTTFDQYLQKAIIGAETFDKAMETYSNLTGKAQQCISSLPAGSVKDGLQSRLDGLSDKSDPKVVEANKILREPINAINGIRSEIQDHLRPLREPLDELDQAVEDLVSKLTDLANPLRDLEALMKKSFGVSFPYPSPTWRHPLRMKDYRISIGFDVILKGSNAIQDEIKRLLSGALYDAAKTFGLEKLIKDLENQAQEVLKEITKKLHLDINVSLPGLGRLPQEINDADKAFSDLVSKLKLDTQPIDDAMQKIEADRPEIEKIGLDCK